MSDTPAGADDGGDRNEPGDQLINDGVKTINGGTGPFARTEILLGAEAMRRLRETSVMVCGIGGVGSYAAEALARAGIGRIIIIDRDVVEESNINRQVHATYATVGLPKTAAMRERILDINPECIVEAKQMIIDGSNAAALIGSAGKLDYIIDAVDDVAAKVALVTEAVRLKIPIISSMGAANRVFPDMFEITDIYQTSVCPLAKAMRRELKKTGVPSLTCVYSKEPPRKTGGGALGSVSFVPPAAGLLLAGHVIRAAAGVNMPKNIRANI